MVEGGRTTTRCVSRLPNAGAGSRIGAAYPGGMYLNEFVVEVPVYRHVTVTAPTEDAARILAEETLLESEPDLDGSALGESRVVARRD